MRKWQAIPVAAVAAFLAGAALFNGGAPVARGAVSLQTLSLVCQVQPSCAFIAGTTGVDVNVVLTNNDTSSISVASFSFEVYNGNKAFLTPSTPVPSALGDCVTSPPVADTGAYGAAATGSTASCFNAASPTGDIVVAASGTAVLGTVHFAAAGSDSASLILTTSSVSDVNSSLFVDCNPDPGSPPAAPTGAGLAACAGATVSVSGQQNTPLPTATPTGTPQPTATPCGANCPAPTTLAFKTITPNAGTLTATAPTKVPATAVPGGQPPPPPPPTGNLPGGGAGAGGSRPITLPDTGTGANNGIDWTAAALLSLLAVAIGGATGALYFGAAHVSASRRGRDS